jgi:hypothetical protein
VEVARTLRAPGSRAQVRRWAEQAALDVLRRHLEGAPIPEQLGPSTRVRTVGVQTPTTAPSGS